MWCQASRFPESLMYVPLRSPHSLTYLLYVLWKVSPRPIFESFVFYQKQNEIPSLYVYTASVF